MSAHVAKRPRGRPQGTSYANADRDIHRAMYLLIASGRAPSITEAARQLVHLAYGTATDDSKIRRLVRTYPH